VNVNAHSLGVVVRSPHSGSEYVSVLISRNTPLPACRKKLYGTMVFDQRMVQVRVLEGESEDPSACITIGECIVAPLPPGLPRGSPISVTFSYDNSGRLHIRAKDETSGLTAQSTIVRAGTLGKDALKRARQAVEQMAVA
jgi:molecular chaperone DnaK (HSP70)